MIERISSRYPTTGESGLSGCVSWVTSSTTRFLRCFAWMLTHFRNTSFAAAGSRWVVQPLSVKLQIPRFDLSTKPSNTRYRRAHATWLRNRDSPELRSSFWTLSGMERSSAMRSTTSFGVPDPPNALSASRTGPKYLRNCAPSSEDFLAITYSLRQKLARTRSTAHWLTGVPGAPCAIIESSWWKQSFGPMTAWS